MAKRSARTISYETSDPYLDLVRAFPLRPLRSDTELERAIAMIDALLDRDDLDSGEEDYLDVLGDLVHKYEVEHYPIGPVSDADLLHFLIQSNDMTQTALSERSGIAESTVSAILAGKRKLSRRHIAILAKVFHISPAVFFPEANEMSPERIADVLTKRCGFKLSADSLSSLASAFAMDADRGCWRAFQEMVGGEVPSMSPDVIASALNVWGKDKSCWTPACFLLTEEGVQSLARAFDSERECWKSFWEMVEETIPDARAIQREIAEEN